jgi:hypothetical protein
MLRNIHKKKIFCFFEQFCADLHSKFRKIGNKSKKNFYLTIPKGIKKRGEFHADFKSVEKVFKKCPQKIISKNWTEICTFFTMFVEPVLLITHKMTKKNLFCKCVSDLNLASSKGLGFQFFPKKVKFVVHYRALYLKKIRLN